MNDISNKSNGYFENVKEYSNIKYLSVIVPIYNGERYLERLLESIFKDNIIEGIQLILINDGSNDRTHEICTTWKEKYKNTINYICKENGGVCSARNAGLDIAKGKYIGFADQDDFFEPNAISLLLKKAKMMTSDMLIFEPQIAYENGKKEIIEMPVNKGIYQNKEMFQKIILPMTFGRKDNQGRGFNYGLWNCLFKKETYSDLRLDTYLRMGEDMTFIVQALSRAESIEILDKPLYNWYCNKKSVSHTYKKITNLQLLLDKEKYIFKKREEAMNKFPHNEWEKYLHSDYAGIVSGVARNWTHRLSGENFFTTRKLVLQVYNDEEINQHVKRLDLNVVQERQRKIEKFFVKNKLISFMIIYFYIFHIYVGIRNGNKDAV